MIPIVKAIKARWDAKSLDSTVTGGIRHGVRPERNQMPACVFTELQNPQLGNSRSKKSGEFRCQFDVYVNSGDPEASGDMAQAVLDALEHSQRAATNPTTAGEGVVICEIQAEDDIMTVVENDPIDGDVSRSFFRLKIWWTKARVLNPAS